MRWVILLAMLAACGGGPSGDECLRDDQCPLGELCDDGTCNPGCFTAADCPAEAPACDGDGDRGACVECMVDDDCAEFYECDDANACVLAPLPPASGLDLLFVIDDSSRMEAEQLELIGAFDDFLVALEAAHGSRPDLHVGVVSTSMGAGSLNAQGCMVSLGGVLQNTPREPCTVAPTADRFLSEVDGEPNFTGTLEEAFACIAPLGGTGCGFERPLDALLAALDPDNQANAGFLRDDAVLAVVILSNEDDCSATVLSLYEDMTETTYGPFSGHRCFAHSVACTPDTPWEHGAKEDCALRESTLFLDIAGAAASVAARKPPGRLAVATLAGPPAPVTVGPDSEFPEVTVASSCVGETTGDGGPALRLHAFRDALGDDVVDGSVCESYVGPLVELAELLATMLDE
jgi:hypothetical protein